MEYRLNKYISASGYCSRREADHLIESGHVTVNGKRATIGMRVLPGQKVKVRGELIKNEIEPVYIAFNKPVGVVSTTDTQEKDNIVDYISHEQRIFPIGRLDKDSQGLILLTNDGDIVNKILRVGNNHKKEYLVKVNKPITKEFLTRMTQGVPILDRVTRRCEIVEINPYTFQISLIQGLNRQIRRMCEYFDYEVTKLERIQIMNIKLGSLGQGNWRNLTPTELEGLFDLLEDSKDVTQARKPANSNKAMNKALQKHDIKTDYRKASSVSKQAKKTKTDKPFDSSAETVKADKTKEKPAKKKGGSGLRVGKSKVSNKKAQTKQRPQSRKERGA
ncbi:23S rRNA pseudouridine2604 synthase [Dysgonomonas sp. PH5-45]|uniref:23S rRNA pseudouridine(2604) synthase RluF n=1 Tax=unclassified Dysgonomonas TaxID=2630389 RepID=UPI002472FA27|nr:MULTISPECIES: 23S rRNA pseudouridine(2604) synthase RluF [unclassified Dysgonomonas]MDH6354627.1 23S rRNA pseudouridine2604 synthase [Dysgonomonas sp. PH5-45]MDH6387525.1 23S rRNA pseudouridine2604 synthase [Dysgonomonas sp. PH5-37]